MRATYTHGTEKTDMASNDSRQVVIGVTGFQSRRDGLNISSDHILRIQLPPVATEGDLELMRNDLRTITRIVDDHPQTVLDMQNAVLNHDIVSANRMANEIGLTEENMMANGGGMWGYILIAAVVIGAYAAFSGGSDEPPPPPPPPPETDAGVPDAGPGWSSPHRFGRCPAWSGGIGDDPWTLRGACKNARCVQPTSPLLRMPQSRTRCSHTPGATHRSDRGPRLI
jgi:hypothetical protein